MEVLISSYCSKAAARSAATEVAARGAETLQVSTKPHGLTWQGKPPLLPLLQEILQQLQQLATWQGSWLSLIDISQLS